MGECYRYFCTQCDYEATVSGGADIGMAAATTTIHCYNCKEISDVMTPWLANDKDSVPTEYHCDRSATHRVALWVGPGECPKCSTTMEVDPIVDILWD